MTYRAAPVSQRDGSPLANSNCRMASIATGIDYHSGGAIVSSGGDMRSRQSDQSGGTDSGDAAEAWASYGEQLAIGDGLTWDDAHDALEAGRCVQLDVWHADAGGPCLSGTGMYGHTMAVAPERSGTRWLTADPWCSPAKWVWWDEALLRAGAEAWGGMTYTDATAGAPEYPPDAVIAALMRLAARRLMSAHRPDAPAPRRPPDTGGSGGRIMFTATRSPAELEVRTDMPINAARGLISELRAELAEGVEFFADPDLTRRLGAMSGPANVAFIGSPIGETIAGGSYAVQVNTGTAYSDGSVRPTIVYVAIGDVRTYSIPPPGDTAAAVAARDAEWRAWALEDAPG